MIACKQTDKAFSLPGGKLMIVARILKDKGRDVVTASPDALMEEVTRLLTDNHVGSLVICDNDSLVGVISERDVVRALSTNGAAILQEPASQHMTKDVFTCTEQDTVHHLMEVMTERRFRHIPVVENEKLVGIVSIGDVVKLRLAVIEMEAESMRDYIKTG
jgi:CBS domain-containing protein